MKARAPFLVLWFLIAAFGCKPTPEIPISNVQNLIDSVKNAHAPDKRVALFSLEVAAEEGQMVVKGETNLPEALEIFQERLSAIEPNAKMEVNLLPDAGLKGKHHAVVKISVANIRSNPKHSAELATQATMGTPLNVLKKEDSWYLVQTPDGYISWVDFGGIQLMDATEYALWKEKEKLIFTEPYGFAYEKPDLLSPTTSDLVGGDILNLAEQVEDFYRVSFPDGREAYVFAPMAQPYREWLANVEASGTSLANVAKKMMGVPYLWGGTSFKGVDCSGFTKTIYFMNGLVIPRDASQQVHAGEEIDTSNGFDQLEVGDLLFFGRPATDSTSERVVHVAMWLGNQEFIHASGHVRVNSFDPAAENFNEYELNRFLRAKRFLSNVKEPILPLQQHNLFITER